MADGFSFEIVGEGRVISREQGGWTLELNQVAWNGRAPKYDLRPWSPDHQKMGKGVTLTREDLLALRDALNAMEL